MLGLDMKEKTGYYLGKCPFHQEENPSFSIKKEGFYKCFSCGQTGSLLTLIYKLTGKSAYKFLNIQDIPSFQFQNFNKRDIEYPTEKSVKDIKVIGSLKNIDESTYVQTYLKDRRVTDQFIKDFSIRYTEYCVVNKTEFKKRIMIPIYKNNQLTGYEGRDYTKTQKPKVLYNAGASISSLFNIDNLDRKNTLIVCEGTMDIPQIYSFITKNVTHTFGAALSYKQKQQLNEFKDIIYFMDNDLAGEKVLIELDKFYNYEFRIAKPPIEGQDPGDLTLEEIKFCLNNYTSSIEYFLDKSKLFDNIEVKW